MYSFLQNGKCICDHLARLLWGQNSELIFPPQTLQFRRLPILEAIKEYSGVDVAGMNEDELRETCEKHLVQPTFITDNPVEMSPLTKRHRSNPELTYRFQDQLKLKDEGDDKAMFIDMDFVRALEYGMPPTSGLGMGIDRLTMFMTNSPTIQDVLFFPQMRPKSL